LNDYVWLFEQHGYERCADGALEEGYEKVALYETEDGDRIHVARMAPSGRWSSKLGRSYDIEHATCESVESVWSGRLVEFMRRPVPEKKIVLP
jgi:hypothetical protein